MKNLIILTHFLNSPNHLTTSPPKKIRAIWVAPVALGKTTGWPHGGRRMVLEGCGRCWLTVNRGKHIYPQVLCSIQTPKNMCQKKNWRLSVIKTDSWIWGSSYTIVGALYDHIWFKTCDVTMILISLKNIVEWYTSLLIDSNCLPCWFSWATFAGFQTQMQYSLEN